jgi:hypothetical protein
MSYGREAAIVNAENKKDKHHQIAQKQFQQN